MTMKNAMNSPASALVFVACNTSGRRAGLLVISVVVLCLGGMLLYFSRVGKLKEIKFSGALLKGESAKLCSTIVAGFILFVGSLCLLSAVFGLDCPRS